MILSDAKNLEIIVNEVESAIKALQDTVLTDKFDAESEETSPFIEQELDTESYNSTSYSIELSSYENSEYSTKNYYELISRDDKIGASMTAVYSAYEHDRLIEAQEIATNIRDGNNTNNPFVEAQIDMNLRDKKNSVKTVSLSLWQSMYDGKIIFN